MRTTLLALAICVSGCAQPGRTPKAGNPFGSAEPRVFWIGGLGDETGPRRMERLMLSRSGLPGEHSYHGHRDEAEVAADALAATGPVVLIGHSFGGAAAMRVAGAIERDGRPAAVLISLDPAWPLPVPRPTGVWRWVNVYQRLSLRDWIATAGCQMGRQRRADANLRGDGGHWDMAGMLDLALPHATEWTGAQAAKSH